MRIAGFESPEVALQLAMRGIQKNSPVRFLRKSFGSYLFDFGGRLIALRPEQARQIEVEEMTTEAYKP